MTAFACAVERGSEPMMDLLWQRGGLRPREALEIEDRGNPELVGS